MLIKYKIATEKFDPPSIWNEDLQSLSFGALIKQHRSKSVSKNRVRKLLWKIHITAEPNHTK